jgi:hypothetical protein
MDNEGLPFRGGGTHLAKVASQSQRMTPTVIPNYSNRKVFSLQLRPKRVVMTDRCDPAKEVSYSTPPKSKILRDSPMLCNGVWKSAVNILSPFNVIPIRRIPQSWEKCELEMIMRINESRQEQKPVEVDVFAVRLGAMRTSNGT